MAGSSSGRGFGLRRGRRALSEIHVVPYIDVTLVLLIIFMVTAPMIVTGTIDLPSSANVTRSSKAELPALQVTIKKDGSYLLKLRQVGSTERVVQGGELAEALKEINQDPSAPVIILADREVAFETVTQAIGKLKEAGLQRVGLLVRQN